MGKLKSTQTFDTEFMPTKLRDIAEHLNISPALVSRVLNDKPGLWASEETKSRILETAQRLNYRPSTAARALVTGRSMLLAVSAADSDWHHARSGRSAELRGLIDAAAQHHYRVLVLASADSRPHQSEFEILVRSKGCDGFCLYAEQANRDLYEFLRSHEMPFVVIGNPGASDVPRVDHDNYALVRDSVEWLAAQGRRRIASIEPSHTDFEKHRPNRPFMKVQKAAFETTMEELFGDFDPALIQSCEWNEAEIVSWVREVQPDALILRGLASTLQWKFALLRAGVRCPDDVLIMAHVDLAELSYLEQGDMQDGLACYVHDPHAAGQKAGEVLIRWINGTPPPLEPILVIGQGPRWC